MRVVLIDGPAGSGKSTLARRLADVLSAQVLHGDDMYEGWSGLATLDALLVGEILEPLSQGRDASFRRWEWLASERAEAIHVPQAPVLVLEGVGIAQQAARRYASLVVFVEAPWDTRIARGLERDGEHMRGEWERWEVEQNAHHAVNDTRAHAHVVIDGTKPVPATADGEAQ
jgi:uridine kinase